MRLAIRREPFDHPDWLYELKYDGFRSFASVEAGRCELISRKAHAYKSFPALAVNLADIISSKCKGGATILDGEIVCLDAEGLPQFDQLFYRRGDPYFYAFDVPFLNGRDLRELALIDRKRLLRDIIPAAGSKLLYVSHIEARGADLFREVCRRDIEGIVAKWKHGPYASGDVTSWVKIKNKDYTQGKGRWEKFQRKQTGRAGRPTLDRAAIS